MLYSDFIQTSDCWLEGRLARGELDPNHMTTAWLIDVQLLSYGHAFVGQVSGFGFRG